MANPEHLKILQQGIEAWNEWRKQNPSIRPDLREANFTEMDFTMANTIVNFNKADLTRAYLLNSALCKADLSESNLEQARLFGVNLEEANLRNADLSGATLCSVSLNEADLSGANLIMVNLIMVYLREANLSGTKFGYTMFGDVDLNSVKALDSCLHHQPSYLAYHTLARSGSLPLSFLRGCGLSDEFIDYLPSLFGQAIQYYSCFISYSTQDQEFADRLYADLQNDGVRCWFAPHDIQGGKKIHEQIDEAIRKYERLLLIVSDSSMNSEWVKTEIANARQKEVEEKQRRLFPIALVEFSKIQQWKCFDADTGKDSAREIREYFIPDFSNWKNHDLYQNAFDRLIRDLKPEKAEAKTK